jgi:beta-N-acetylhexosaminidase
MSAHILFSALDAQNPATLSSTVLEGLLRHDLGFGGVIITDAMDMAPVARFGAAESARRAIEAGADLVLMAHLPDQLELGHQLAHLARPGALARIQTLRERAAHPLPPLEQVGCAEHLQIAQAIADRSITLVRDSGNLPLRPGADDLLVVITPQPVDLTPADTSSRVRIGLAGAIRRRHARTLAIELPNRATSGDIGAILQATESAHAVIVGTAVADRDAAQAELVRAIHARGQKLIVVALRTPYDLSAFPMIETYLCAYGIRSTTTEAVARVLFGEIEARGVLPCAIPGIVAPQG